MTEFLLDTVAWSLHKDGVTLDIAAWPLHKDGVTLDIAAWPLHKNDMHDLRWFFFERYRNMACTRMTRTNPVVSRRTHGSLLKDDTRKSRREHSTWAKITSLIRDTEKISLTHAQGDTQNRV